MTGHHCYLFRISWEVEAKNQLINGGPGHSCHVHGKTVPSWRSYWPACIQDSTYPDCSHTSGERPKHLFD